MISLRHALVVISSSGTTVPGLHAPMATSRSLQHLVNSLLLRSPVISSQLMVCGFLYGVYHLITETLTFSMRNFKEFVAGCTAWSISGMAFLILAPVWPQVGCLLLWVSTKIQNILSLVGYEHGIKWLLWLSASLNLFPLFCIFYFLACLLYLTL